MTTTLGALDSLYKARRSTVSFVEVPELCYLTIDGRGDPNGADFAGAVGALYAASYAAHFMLKKLSGEVPKVRPLESLWWVQDAAQAAIVIEVATGQATMWDTDRNKWHWRAMIVQPEHCETELLVEAIEVAAVKHPGSARPSVLRWREGRCAQVMHVGPYADEAPTIRLLHESIAAAGCRPRGRHHEIYLGDPRRCAPERLRTILRQPVESIIK